MCTLYFTLNCGYVQVFELKVLSALSLRRLRGLHREDIEAHIGRVGSHVHVYCYLEHIVYIHEKNVSGGARQAKRSLDSAVSSLLALISREYAQLV